MENVPNWDEAIENVTIPNEIMVLENSIHQHQNLYELMCQAYTEVYIQFYFIIIIFPYKTYIFETNIGV